MRTSFEQLTATIFKKTQCTIIDCFFLMHGSDTTIGMCSVNEIPQSKGSIPMSLVLDPLH
jgi:hypothetical protein